MEPSSVFDKNKLRRMKAWAKHCLRGIFELSQRAGFDVLPRNFYSSIPNIKELRRSSYWREPFEMYAVAGASLTDQVALLTDLCKPFLHQWSELDVHGVADRENGQGGGYGIIEAEVLHAFVRGHRPGRIVQVGCGVSTSVIIRAATMANYWPEIICVEPYPSAFLRTAQSKGQITLLRERAQETPRSVFADLAAGDLLFVDSTHTVFRAQYIC